MTWVRLEDHIDEHPKFAAVGPLGLALFVTGLAYCNRNLTDGHIPWAVGRSLLSWEFLEPANGGAGARRMTVGVRSGMAGDDVTCEYVIDLLLAAGLWEEEPGGYYVHDFSDYQPLREGVLVERKAARERMQKHRKSRGSPELRRNGAVTSDEVQGKFKDPVPVPEEKRVLNRTSTLLSAKADQAAVEEVFEYWRSARQKSDRLTLTPGRRDKIRARLKEFTVNELKRAIDAVASDPWPERYRFDDIPHLFGSREKVERWLASADGGPVPVVGRKRTGWRWVRGSGGGTYVRDELGTDPLPPGYVTGAA